MKPNYSNIQDAFVSSLHLLLEQEEVIVRGMETKEILGHAFSINNPTERVMLLRKRNINIFAQLAETFWMLAGRDDLDWLETYIPSCKQWSDDGKHWRDAYGPRLRQWGATYESSSCGLQPIGVHVDQIKNVIEKLKEDINTRQAVMTIWDPTRDWIRGSKAYPCNNLIQFIVRNGKLHTFVYVRSNDVMYGFSHNDAFSWSVLQQAIASWIGVSVGKLHWNVGSFHLYEKHYDLAVEILENNWRYENPQDNSIYDHVSAENFTIPYMLFDAELDGMFTELENCEYSLDGLKRYGYEEPYSGYIFMDTVIRMLLIYNYYISGASSETIYWMVNNLPECDLRYAAIEFFARKPEYDLDKFFMHSVNLKNYMNFAIKGN
jgi:thymidylate synthase